MLMEFSNEEIKMMVEDGFEPGYMGDVQEGDLVAIPPVSRVSFDGEPKPVKTLVVKRMMRIDGSYFEPDADEIIRNVVINFIGTNLDNLPEHCSYGSTYPCFYKRQS